MLVLYAQQLTKREKGVRDFSWIYRVYWPTPSTPSKWLAAGMISANQQRVVKHKYSIWTMAIFPKSHASTLQVYEPLPIKNWIIFSTWSNPFHSMIKMKCRIFNPLHVFVNLLPDYMYDFRTNRKNHMKFIIHLHVYIYY